MIPTRLEAYARQIVERGFSDPLRILSGQACRGVLAAVPSQPPAEWAKGYAACSRLFYEVATRPPLLEVANAVLGGNVMLWGVSLIVRPPGSMHPWHTDIESSSPAGRTVTAWMGLEHTSRRTALRLIPFSHRFGVSLQQVAQDKGVRRADIRDHHAEAWARERDPRCCVESPDIGNGEALFFDGRTWHGSYSQDDRHTRTALLIQYATPDTPIRIPDLKQLEWPFRQLEEPRPPCLLLRGEARTDDNRFVPGPMPAGSRPRLHSGAFNPPASLRADSETGWTPHVFFAGGLPDLEFLGCHTSVLAPGACPHPPHHHPEEEILTLIEGEIELVLPDLSRAEGGPRHRLLPGGFAYYPAHFAHTLIATGSRPARYVMLRWRGWPSGLRPPLRHGRFAAGPVEHGDEFQARLRFEGPTDWLRLLHSHVSTLRPGAGYEPHRDAHHVALVVLEGRVETLGETVGAGGVAFAAAGDAHGIRNPGPGMAGYAVFEFHGHTARSSAVRSKRPSFRRWTDRLRGIVAVSP